MGGISSRLTRQFYRFNAENRAHKIIQSKKPRPAPKQENTLKQIEMIEKEMPSVKDELAKFDPKLHERLKQVYVTSDVTPAEKAFTKPPPLSHSVRRTTGFGFDESEPASAGHITLKDAVQMIMTHYKEDDCKIEDLANRYKIKVDDAANIVKYYQCFTLHFQRGKFDVAKTLNTVMFGNERGEILLSDQFIKRLEEQKGVRDELTRGIPPLNRDVIEWDKEEEKKRAISSGTGRKPSETKRIESENKD